PKTRKKPDIYANYKIQRIKKTKQQLQKDQNNPSTQKTTTTILKSQIINQNKILPSLRYT
ncbi:hypothetical protein, partial [Kosakonia cowanii]|uniref:hypothetical protein n=1 Tax=Kosakonia cowanii TaxID=208223 RepID=UPI0039AEB4A7